MKRILMFLPIAMLFVAMVASAQLVAPGADTAPKVGEKAPDFEFDSSCPASTLGSQPMFRVR